MTISNDSKFREVQYMRQWWFMLLLISSDIIALAVIAGVIPKDKIGQAFTIGVPAVLVMLGVTALFFFANLKTEVKDDGLYIKFFPFHFANVKISLEEVASVEPVSYSPLKDYGGWGIRYAIRGKAYNPVGHRGVKITYANGRHILIGSQKPEELVEAIKSLL